ncbi:metalloendopeptidase [Hanseniaspora uvarum]|nr:metalloendopeptidase [Hanseniaspora uvarum]
MNKFNLRFMLNNARSYAYRPRRNVQYRDWNKQPLNSVNSANSFGGIPAYFRNLTPSKKKNFMILGSLLAGFYAVNLEEVPISHRIRFSFIPHFLIKKIGDISYNSVFQQYGKDIKPENSRDTVKVRKIFNELLKTGLDFERGNEKVQLLRDLDWEVFVIADPGGSFMGPKESYPPNAFIVPNGKVFVFESLIKLCNNGDEDMLATVLAHELSHQLCGHSGESLSKSPLYFLLGITVYAATGLDFGRLLIDFGLKLPASRNMELEADYSGLLIMSQSCYNPNKSWMLWEKMNQFEKKQMGQRQSLEFLSTHPSSTKREQKFKEWLPKAQELYEHNDCSRLKSMSSDMMSYIKF